MIGRVRMLSGLALIAVLSTTAAAQAINVTWVTGPMGAWAQVVSNVAITGSCGPSPAALNTLPAGVDLTGGIAVSAAAGCGDASVTSVFSQQNNAVDASLDASSFASAPVFAVSSTSASAGASTVMTLTASSPVDGVLIVSAGCLASGSFAATVDIGNDGTVEFSHSPGPWAPAAEFPITIDASGVAIGIEADASSFALSGTNQSAGGTLTVQFREHVHGTFASFGTACPGSNGLPLHLAINLSGHPDIGTTSYYILANGPIDSVTFLDFGLSNTMAAGGFILPLNVTPFGAPGCFHRTNSLARHLLPTDSLGVAFMAFSYPNSPGLVGLPLHTQCISSDPTVNALGFSYSNGLTTTIGGVN